jgi:hypothetical protein
MPDNQRLTHTYLYSYISFQAFYKRHLLIKVDPLETGDFFFQFFCIENLAFFSKTLAKLVKFTAEKINPFFIEKR